LSTVTVTCSFSLSVAESIISSSSSVLGRRSVLWSLEQALVWCSCFCERQWQTVVLHSCLWLEGNVADS